MTQEELVMSAKFIGVALMTIIILLGFIAGSLLENRFDFWKW